MSERVIRKTEGSKFRSVSMRIVDGDPGDDEGNRDNTEDKEELELEKQYDEEQVRDCSTEIDPDVLIGE